MVIVSYLTSKETFFSCMMYKHRYNPQVVESSIPGDIAINGVLRLYGQDIPISDFRNSFVESIIESGDGCRSIDFTTCY